MDTQSENFIMKVLIQAYEEKQKILVEKLIEARGVEKKTCGNCEGDGCCGCEGYGFVADGVIPIE